MIYDLNSLVRTGTLVLHCTKVKIWQKMESGIQLSGYGTIEIDLNGLLKLEFICLKAKNVPSFVFNRKLPDDVLIQEQKLYLEVETLDGKCYESNGFLIDLCMNIERSPVIINLNLSSLSCLDASKRKLENHNFLYFEFSEYFDIPANRMNKEESTLGSMSVSWNETIIDCNGFSVSIKKLDRFGTVEVSGLFDVKNVFECLKFYIGFSCGSMPQPYFVCERVGTETITTVYSINKSYRNKISSNPMVSNVVGYEDKSFHYNLFKSMLGVRANSPIIYESIYSQWFQVWHSFQSTNGIASLALSVAVEGLLNDVFIPSIKIKNNNEKLDNDIKEIKKMISVMEIDALYKQALKNSISFLKKQTAAKALDYLVSREIITNNEKKSWTDLRNACAHPEVKEDSLAAQMADRDRVLSCLNLFHTLVFNALAYSGPRNYFESGNICCYVVEHKVI